MLHAIGRKQPSANLVDLLLACHGRIRQFLDMAIAVGEHRDVPVEDIVEGAQRVRRYFSEALPLHVEDEEEGVLPRLRGRSLELDIALERMSEEHDRHLAPLRRLRELTAAVAASPRDGEARLDLVHVARQLRADLEPHLEAEERTVFPAIQTLLTREEEQAIVSELRARRRAP
jgi:iron-sulfur cluster repair protein YtfE (RIC family)